MHRIRNGRKALIVTTRQPFPEVGGERVRLGLIARALATKYEVDMLVINDPVRLLAGAQAPPYVHTYTEVPLSRVGTVFRAAAAVATGKSAQVRAFVSKAIGRQIEVLSRQADVVVFHLARTTEYLQYVNPGRICVAELTDAISGNYSAFARQAGVGVMKKGLLRLEAERLGRYEAEVTRRFRRTWVVAERDADVIERAGGLRPLVRPNAYDLARLQFRPGRAGRRMCMIGNFVSLQNLDGLQWFLSEVFPSLRSRGFDLKVVGNISGSDARRLGVIPGCHVTGRVPSIAEAVGDCVLGLSPVRAAGGMQNKIIEYAALGLPVVASNICADGLPEEIKERILRFSGKDDCIEQVLAASLGGSALMRRVIELRGLVEYFYGEARFAERIIADIES